MWTPCSLCVSESPPQPRSWMPEPIVMKQYIYIYIYIMTPEPISVAYFINPPPHQPVSGCVFPMSLIVNGSVNTFPRLRLLETKNCLDVSFLCGACCMRREYGYVQGTHVPAALKNFWYRFLCSPCLIYPELDAKVHFNISGVFFPRCAQVLKEPLETIWPAFVSETEFVRGSLNVSELWFGNISEKLKFATLFI
jgi:hypothetical protein